MAKIRDLSLKVFGGYERFTVTYSAKYNNFEIKLPAALEDYRVASGVDFSEKTEKELMAKLTDFIYKYENESVKQRKIIVYKFEWSSKNIKGNHNDRWDAEGRNTDEAMLQFQYEVLIEKSVNENVRFYREEKYDDETEVRLIHTGQEYSSFDIIEYTPEAEKFFSDFYASMESLIKKLKKFVNTPELVIASVHQGLKLLPAREKT